MTRALAVAALLLALSTIASYIRLRALANTDIVNARMRVPIAG